ncbi:hypothetical protein PQR05_20650 [Paraburkholderia sediminicola]|jgi:hypothetical protein|uniref:hypothetical protein n=1 Tax=Paraburkholderia sediminicola TaxID=458836 RepID=UPI0038B7CC70
MRSAKAVLLPQTAKSARAQSLRHHLVLEALKAGSGNGQLLTDLIRVIYVTWYLQLAGFGTVDPRHYVAAERALARCGVRGVGDDIWQLDQSVTLAIERILALHDWQLEHAPISAMLEVQRRLARFVQSDKESPWQHIEG